MIPNKSGEALMKHINMCYCTFLYIIPKFMELKEVGSELKAGNYKNSMQA